MDGIKRIIMMVGIGIMASVYMSIYSMWGISYDHDRQSLIDTESLIESVEAKFDPEDQETRTRDVTRIVKRHVPKGTKKKELLDAFKAVGFTVSRLSDKVDYDAMVYVPLPMTHGDCAYTLTMKFDFYPRSTRVDRMDGETTSTCQG